MQAIYATPFTFSDEKHVEDVKVCRLDQLDPLSRFSVKFEIKRIDGMLNQACISDFNRKLMLMAKTG